MKSAIDVSSDLLRAHAGVCYIHYNPGRQTSALQLVDVFVVVQFKAYVGQSDLITRSQRELQHIAVYLNT
jgi:hypothetical protein